NCALGIVQMRRLDEILSRRAQVARWYLDRLSDEPRIHLQRIGPEIEMSWFVFVVRLSDDYSQADRDAILEKLRAAGIGCSNYFTPIHLQPFYQDFGCRAGQFPITEALSARTVALPFHNGLCESDVDRVVATFRATL
ncbi:MAG: polysaccharide biosynthesis protein, partial [Planctomycetota bacterium]